MVQARLIQGKLNDVLGEDLEGQKGSELVFGILTRLTERVSPQVISEFTQRLFETEWRITDSESQWISDFSNKKGFSELHELLKIRKNQVSVLDLMNEVRVLSEKKVVEEGMRLLAKIQNERMKETALVILEMDRSGELFSLLDSAQLIFKKGETP